MLTIYKRFPSVLAISFDLDDTLYDNMPIIQAAENKLLSYLIERFPALSELDELTWQHKKSQFTQKNQRLAHDVSLLRKHFLTDLLLSANVTKASASALQAYEYFHQHRNNFMVAPSCIELLYKMKQKVPLIAITNGNADPELIGLSGIFDAVIRPQNELLMKPDKAIFELASKQLNIPAKNIVHVGDSHITDVQGAINSNMTAGWFNPNKTPFPGSVLPEFEYTETEDLLDLI